MANVFQSNMQVVMRGQSELFLQLARHMHLGRWAQALALLDLDCEAVQSQSRLLCVGARCHLKLGAMNEALRLSDQALHVDPDHVYAYLLKVRLLLSMGKMFEALQTAAQAFKIDPSNAMARLALANLVVNLHGDWQTAQYLWRPLASKLSHRAAVQAFQVKYRQYNDADGGLVLSRQIVRFAQTQLTLAASKKTQIGALATLPRAHGRRLRVGFVSPMFRCGPVYFLCIGALRLLAQDFDLVFFSRSSLNDWATQAFKALASQWHDLDGASAEQLHDQMQASQLDALFDLCGWLDLTVLKALSCKPAPLLFKWVGGQVCTTGLDTFDGFLTDRYQSGNPQTKLHTEPMLALRNGYVTYTPPPYMPEPKAPRQGAPYLTGVISHPMKLSGAFMAYLRSQIQTHASAGGPPVVLRFIGKRYAIPSVQKRVLAALEAAEQDKQPAAHAVEVQFVTTQGHDDFLNAVAELDWVIDTFPYSCGLTALEALSLGVPLRTRPGQHVHERHAYSHCRFAGLSNEQILLSRLGAFGAPVLYKDGTSLLKPGSARLAHSILASSLAQLVLAPPAKAPMRQAQSAAA